MELYHCISNIINHKQEKNSTEIKILKLSQKNTVTVNSQEETRSSTISNTSERPQLWKETEGSGVEQYCPHHQEAIWEC